jgi:hypothetical protein
LVLLLLRCIIPIGTFNELIVYLQYQNTILYALHNFFQAIRALDLVYLFYDSTLSDPSKMKTFEGKYHNYAKYQYLYKLEENHKRLRNLENLLEIGKTNNLPIFFCFTPIIHKNVERSGIKNAFQQLEANKNLVKKLINKYGYEIHDFTFLLPADKMLTYEHMTTEGKKEFAHAIAAELRGAFLQAN